MPDKSGSAGNRRPLSRWIKPEFLLFLVGALCAPCVVAGRLHYSPDSRCYLTAAECIRRGQTLRTWDGRAYTEWPPLLPLVVAGAHLVVPSPEWAAIAVMALCAGGILASAYQLLARHTAPPLLVPALVAVALSPPLGFTCTFLWSEPLFVVLTTAFLTVAERRDRWRNVLLMAVLAALACLTRYVGVVLVATGLILLLWDRRWRYAAAFLTSLIPLGLWLARNYTLAGTLMGPRQPAEEGPLVHVWRLAATVARWCAPRIPDGPYLNIIVAAVFGIGIALLMVGRRRLPPPCWLFSVLYALFLVATSSLSQYDPIGPRLTVPLYVPLLVLLAAALSPGKAPDPAAGAPDGP